MMRTRMGWISLIVLAAGPQPLLAQGAAPTRIELPNGLVVWVQEDHRRPAALVQTVYKVGSLNEAPGATGTAHYVEHMMYHSTEHVRIEDIFGDVDRLGGRWTGSTSQTTNYGELVPSWGLEAAIRLTAERMGHATFDSVEFVRERNMVVTEANGFARSDPVSAFRDAVMRTSFELHPYRYSSNTWAQDNLLVSREVVRDFWRRFYGPNNAVISVVGDVRTDDVRRLVETYFGALPRAPETGEVRIVEPPQRVEKRVRLSSPGVRPQVEIVWRAPPATHPDYAVLAVLDRILGPRVRRAAASAGATDPVTAHEARPYPFVYRFTASADSGADLESIVHAVQNEMDRVGRDGVTSDELAAARETSGAASGGRGGRGGGGRGATASANIWNPARVYPVLGDLATSLAAREVLPWEVGPDLLARIARAQQTVTSADLQRYVDRWLRVSQRTVGFLVPGTDDFQPAWSTDRALIGERVDVPPMLVPPAKRRRPNPVPARSLEPLPKLDIPLGRHTLANGVTIRVARGTQPGAAVHVRVSVGGGGDPPGKEGVALVSARLVASDPALAALAPGTGPLLGGATSIANEGVLDFHVHSPTDAIGDAARALARAITVHTFTIAQLDAVRASLSTPLADGANGGRGGARAAGGGGRGNDAAALAQRTAIEAVAPMWLVVPPYTPRSLSRITTDDVRAFLDRAVVGGAVSVSVVAPLDTGALVAAAADAFSLVPQSAGPAHSAASKTAAPSAPRDARARVEERIALPAETQVTIVAGLPAVPSDHPDRRALELLNYIVGLPQYGGRLGFAITRGGLAYATAATTTSGVKTGFILLSTKTDTHNSPATIQCIREIVEGVGAKGVEPWELDEAKSFVLGRTLLYGPWNDSDNETIAAALIESGTRGEELLDLPALSRSTLGVTLEQVNAAARRWYRAELLEVITVGAIPPAGEKSPFKPGVFRASFEP